MACKPWRNRPDDLKRKAEVEAALRSSRTRQEAARRLGIGVGAMDFAARTYGLPMRALLRPEAGSTSMDPSDALADENKRLRAIVRRLEKELDPLRAAEAKRALVDEQIRKAAGTTVSAKPWLISKEIRTSRGPGTPTLMLSDLHMNETVDPRQVLGANAFSPEKAGLRLRTVFETTVDIAKNHTVRPSYDGIEVPVLGDLLDLLGGFIHASERQGDPIGIEAAAMVADKLEPGFRLLADAFGAVRSRWVTGNHGRYTVQMPYQDRTAKSLDAAVFYILAGRLAGDKRFTMEIAPGPRFIYQLYGTKFMLLHGDPASGMPKGGDSESGAVNVVARGVKRLRSLHLQIGMPFDFALMGHWHTRMRIPGAIVNGSLPGYGEYAFGRASPFEPPQQVLFFTHPKWGITSEWPLYADRERQEQKQRVGT